MLLQIGDIFMFMVMSSFISKFGIIAYIASIEPLLVVDSNLPLT
jgi:hypothetical protein